MDTTDPRLEGESEVDGSPRLPATPVPHDPDGGLGSPEDYRRYLEHDDAYDGGEVEEPVPQRSEVGAIVEYWKMRTAATKAPAGGLSRDGPRSSSALPALRSHRPPRHGSRKGKRGGASFYESLKRASTPLEGRRPASRGSALSRRSSQTGSVASGATALTAATGQSATMRALEATRACVVARRDSEFWQNRAQRLRREVERAQQGLDKARLQGSKAEVATVLNETVAAQLELERQRNLRIEEERREAIRAHKIEHHIALRQAQQQQLQQRQEIAVAFKEDAVRHRDEISKEREAERAVKARRREAVRVDKVTSMVARARQTAMKREECHRAYEAKVQRVEQARREEEERMVAAIEEASALVGRVQRIKSLGAEAEAANSAMLSLTTSVYRDRLHNA